MARLGAAATQPGDPDTSAVRSAWRGAIEPGRDDGRLVAEGAEEPRPAKLVGMPRSLDPGVIEALRGAGISSLYSHQVESLEAAAGGSVIVTSGTASGKSLCFNLPVLDGLARDPRRRALYLYPTKALAQDQARALSALDPPKLRHAIYDGDTPREDRPAIRRRSNLVLTNPDMLNVGILPHHRSWGDFLANLGWVVVDEAHAYRGVFGSHVANVLRRLRRVARLYGAEPRFLLASATIANPVELAERLCGESFTLVDSDGAPRAARRIAMWNPPLIDERSGTRRSALSEAADLLAGAGRRGAADDLLPAQPPRDRADPALHARAAARGWPREARRADRSLPRRLHAPAAARDRGGAVARRAARSGRDRRARARDRRRRARRGDLRHLPGHRREPAADVGPRGAAQRGCWRSTSPARTRWTSSSAATRTSSSASRRGGDPRPRERADPVSAPDRRGLRGAARRRRAGCARGGGGGGLAGRRDARPAVARARRRAWFGSASCAGAATAATWPRCRASRPGQISLRSASADSVAVVERASGELLGGVEAERAFSTVHPGAVYLHLGRSYEVRELDVEARRAVVERFDGDWYTQPKKETEVFIERRSSRPVATAGVELSFGAVSVTEQVIAFQRKRLSDHEVIDMVAARASGAELPHPGAVVRAPPKLAGAAAQPRSCWAPCTRPSTARSRCCRCSRCATAGTSAACRPTSTSRPGARRSSSTTAIPAGSGSRAAASSEFERLRRRRGEADRRVPVRGRLPVVRPEPQVRQPQRAAAQGRCAGADEAVASRNVAGGTGGSIGGANTSGRGLRRRRESRGRGARCRRGGGARSRRGWRRMRVRRARRRDGGRRPRRRRRRRRGDRHPARRRSRPRPTRTAPTSSPPGSAMRATSPWSPPADAVIAIGGEWGTLSEIAFARRARPPGGGVAELDAARDRSDGGRAGNRGGLRPGGGRGGDRALVARRRCPSSAAARRSELATALH